MPRSRSPILSTLVVLLLAGSSQLAAQSPFWSTYFGGAGTEEIVAVRRGPGDLITVVGHTDSTGLSHGAVFQQSLAGSTDAFVARFDPSLPPAQQLLWCTYLGGTGMELVFDAEVDQQTGFISVVGLSLSTTFPGGASQPSPLLNGPSDGFVAQIDPTGSVLLTSMFVGGSGDDRVCEVELDSSGLELLIAGVTESSNLPWTLGSVFPAPHGGASDAFVARVAPFNPPGSQGLWATYLGGASTDGVRFSVWGGLGVNGGAGSLDRMALTLDAAGNPVLATISFFSTSPALTTATAISQIHAGAGDVYLVLLDAAGTTLQYATFFGGALSDAPRAIRPHPAGGYVIGGLTFSGNMPVTPGCLQSTLANPVTGSLMDGFVCHIDPALGSTGLLYATYLGGDLGNDPVLALEVETSGIVTVAGWSDGGNFPTTSRCLQDALGSGQTGGMVARLALDGQGGDDLLYATFVGGVAGSTNTRCNSICMDDVGDVYVVGSTDSSAYPMANAQQSALVGREGVLTHLALLPGNVQRVHLPLATPACGVPLYTGAGNAPVPGQTFFVTATNAPPGAPSILVLGGAIFPTPLPTPFNGTLLVNPLVLLSGVADAYGAARVGIPVPSTAPVIMSWNLGAQWLFFTTPTCPGSGVLATSERLAF
ncbi:MAG: hypothetical protein ACI8UD_001476 [Planctomycetota bacterium]|jgi:hypothetical protein